MTSDETPMPATAQPSEKPYFSVGAGSLASFLWKKQAENASWQYEFNLFRVAAHGQVSQLFTPADLLDVIKLVQVLGLALTDDDLSPPEHRKLVQLSESLEQLLRRFQQDADDGAALAEPCHKSRQRADKKKKGHHP